MTTRVVYLDTNIISRLVDFRMSEANMLAYGQIAKVDGISLVTSAKTREEMERTKNESRASMLLFLFTAFSKVPWSIAERSGAFGRIGYNMTAYGASWAHPMLKKLRAIFDRDDAGHIFQATQADCDYFLTLDEKTILSRARDNQPLLDSLCPRLRFRSPVELAAELNADA